MIYCTQSGNDHPHCKVVLAVYWSIAAMVYYPKWREYCFHAKFDESQL